MKKETIDLVLDVATREGRIKVEDRGIWVRRFEAAPEEATALIALSPSDPQQAANNCLPSDEEQRKQIARELGLRLSEVI